MNATEIRETVAKLPKLPAVYAVDMLRAQGWKPTAEERAAIKARADFFRSLDLPAEVNIQVRYVHNPAEVVGHLAFNLH